MIKMCWIEKLLLLRVAQIPSCEFFPVQAVKTNVLGAENVIRAVITTNAKKLIVLSIDKAVYL